MKIAILTLPLHNNYGGIIQATALSQTLRDMGHETFLISKKAPHPLHKRLMGYVLRSLPGQNIRGARQAELERRRHYSFTRARFDGRSGYLRTPEDLGCYLTRNGIDAVVVGSDQVWRADYFRPENLEFYFLALVGDYRGRKIAYAPSFGKDEWPLPDRVADVGRWLADFDAVSCRETSGTELLQNSFGCSDAQTCIDPTLLVDPGFYDAALAPSTKGRGYVLRYVLDESDTLQSAASHVVEALDGDLEVRTITPDDGKATLDISGWLRAFKDADFIVTDSFHGTVFSILFGKNFVSIGNVDRGLDRFTSLLSQLGLQDRLLLDDDMEKARHLAGSPVDFEASATRLAELRAASMSFLKNALEAPRAS